MSNNGIVMLAQNSNHDYVLQACLCAMSLCVTNPSIKVSIITNDTVPKKYLPFIDQIIPINEDDASSSEWKVENRWKIYELSPYDETIVMDTDMLILRDISDWWNNLSTHNIYFSNMAKTYRGEDMDDTYYRKAFRNNDLPNIYSTIHYFKKSDQAKEFYELLGHIVKNWEQFYKTHAPKNTPKHVSIDVSASIAAKILDIDITGKQSIDFIHLKSQNQGWKLPSENWRDRLGVYLTKDLKLKLGNYAINDILHYTEKDFVTEEIVKLYEEYLNVK